jgi:DnaJ-class molecular chaperone
MELKKAHMAGIKKQLKIEREKVTCNACRGSGWIISACGTFESQSQCHKCRGEGKVTY